MRKQLKPREKTIDIVRGLTLLLMLFTHVIALFFTHRAENISYWVAVVGGTISFVLFLFLAGISINFSYLSIPSNYKRELHEKTNGLVQKIAMLVLSYLLIGTLIQSFIVNQTGSDGLLTSFAEVLTLQTLPPYIEFILAFILYFLSVLILRLSYKFTSRRVGQSIFIGLILLILGFFGSFLLEDSFNRVIQFKSLFFGSFQNNSFPVFQYWILFILGSAAGYAIKTVRAASEKRLFYQKGLLIAGIITGVLFLIDIIAPNQITSFDVLNHRFPPNITFISIGITSVFLLLFLIQLIYSKVPSIFTNYLTFISKHTFLFFNVHLLVLVYIATFLFEQNSLNTDETLVLLFVGVTLVTSIATLIFSRISKSFYPYLKKNGNAFAVTSVFIVIMGASGVLVSQWIEFNTPPIVSVSAAERVLGTGIEQEWWDRNYLYRANITEQIDMNVGAINRVYVNHSEYLQSQISKQENASDVDVIGLKNGVYVAIPRNVNGANTSDTLITFQVTDQFQEIYLYSGNNTFKIANNPLTITSDINSESSLSVNAFLPQPINVEADNRWHLIGLNNDPIDTVTFTITTDNYNENSILRYKFNGTWNYDAVEVGNGVFEVTKQISQFPIGRYDFFVEVINIGAVVEVFESNVETVNVSNPVFVTWTIDWEGMGVNQNDLNEIVAISDEFGVPMVHFFNPRIYVQNQYTVGVVNPSAAQYYTSWVLNRRNLHGDEVGLHLHLYPDLLEEVGVERNEDAQIVGINRDETYLHGYGYEDLSTIVAWSVEKFQEFGIGVPTSFRSGAWMSSADLLKALYDNGVRVDSSARTAGILNPSVPGSTPIPWNVSPTATPYLPGEDDISVPSPFPIGIWEFPNNGADSFWFSEDNLIERFTMNFNINTVVQERPQVVTYLSHPHDFVYFDSAKIRSLFSYIEQYNYEKGRGPVVFSTLENIYRNFNLQAF